MPPAARISDMHTCPMVTGIVPHVGGPIMSGFFTVIIGCMPAARLSDQAICVGPPDVIVKGSPTVIIGGMLAARIGDPTAHGGVIVLGCPTVIIGEVGAGAGLSPSAGGANLSGAMAAASSDAMQNAGAAAADPQCEALQEAAGEGLPLSEVCPYATEA